MKKLSVEELETLIFQIDLMLSEDTATLFTSREEN